jgi:hypothetical protein
MSSNSPSSHTSVRRFPNFSSLESYRVVGAILGVAGVAMAALSVVITGNSSNGFFALGLATILIGVTAFFLPRQIKASGAMNVMIEDAAISTDKILESVVVPYIRNLSQQHEVHDNRTDRTLFLPPNGSTIYAFVPVRDSNSEVQDLTKIRSAPFAGIASSFMQVEGVLVYPVGATLPNLPELKRSEGALPVSIQDALEFVLVDSTEVCSSLNSSEIGDTVIVELSGIKVNTAGKSYPKFLGSIPASLAASVTTTIRAKPVSIVDETDSPDGKKLVRIKVRS